MYLFALGVQSKSRSLLGSATLLACVSAGHSCAECYSRVSSLETKVQELEAQVGHCMQALSSPERRAAAILAYGSGRNFSGAKLSTRPVAVRASGPSLLKECAHMHVRRHICTLTCMHGHAADRGTSSSGQPPPAAAATLPIWATCTDQSDQIVQEIGYKSANETFTCFKAKAQGLCVLPLAHELCPRMCERCPQPSARTWIEGGPRTPSFCLASEQK